MENRTLQPHRVSAEKPAGGFAFITGNALLSAWAALQRRQIELRDLRVWLACFELLARRSGSGSKRRPRYTVEELHELTGGVGGEHTRRSIRQLERVGLLTWSETKINPQPQIHQLTPAGERVRNRERPIPVPRRTIRYLVRASSRAEIATVFGHLLRCLYYRGGRCISGGRCKAGWVAETFGIHVRTVKAARGRLVAAGWLTIGHASQTELNRWGPPVLINLNWRRPASESPPQRRQSTTGSPPPERNKKLFLRRSETRNRAAARPGEPCKQGSPPRLRAIRLDDLKSPERLDALHRQAVETGLLTGAEFDRLQFFTAAEHAIRRGQNPPALFNWLIRRKKWDHLTMADEDRARRAMKGLDFGEVSGHAALAGLQAEAEPRRVLQPGLLVIPPSLSTV